MKILANDGISQSGIDALESAGFEVSTTTVAQEQLINYINENNITVLLVRSATTVRKDLIDACPSLKIIGRGGVGMDNIDVDYAREKGLKVINTPAASSHSVGELVFGHFYGIARFLHNANRDMPLEGDTNFKGLKKAYAKGIELKGKTLGVLGFGRIGQATAKIALGAGMKVVAYDPYMEKANLKLDFFDGQSVDFNITTISKEDVLKQSDFISLHVPAQKEYIIDDAEFNIMKDGVIIANAARGGVLNEVALVKAIESGKVTGAALDVFENEPKPELQLLMNSSLSLTPHIGAATNEAQDRIGTELATQIKEILL
ncbi:D-2-hydroxyacid dehydrogenase [Lacinutrix venerupis]|uniref:3-phosphoglycerate dehydrogenase n=1 Tax=Lacinutrix venerupis TaxID=1486034 RepID=A0AAC9LMZ2_9FLAO|nr:D-2-hydroxyacid dehydrogenase [Lacinutrix venerupis]APY00365.1 3-phosphoglycerate dehydrogenase [Lacinutrix venerupis]